MKKSLSLLLVSCLYLSHPTRGEDDLMLAVNTNFKPARPAGEAAPADKTAVPEIGRAHV